MALKHTFVSAKADGADGTIVRPVDWNAEHVVDTDGLLFNARTNDTDPSVPAADKLLIYAKNIAGRTMPKWMPPSGVDMIIQSHIGTNNCRLVIPGSGTTVGVYPSNVATPGFASMGMTISTALISTGGSIAQATIASTNLLTQTKRAQLVTGATSGAGMYLKGDQTEVWRGNAAGLGGFFFVARFAISTTVASSTRVFVGLVDVTTAPTNVDYEAAGTTTPGRIGMSLTQNAGNNRNWQLNRTASGSAPTLVDLGANFVTTTSHLLELILFAKPNDSVINYRVTNISTGNVTSGNVSTNIPSSTTFLTPRIHVNNNTAASSTLDVVKMYLETDY